MKFLSRIEEILLLAIWKLKGDAYGMAIRELVEKETGMKWVSGAIYAPLNRLRKSGYVTTTRAEGTTERGGRPRIYYRITPLGMKRLISLQEVTQSIWNQVPDLKNQ